MRHAVIGDVGGHAHDLWAEVERLGGDPRSGRLPDDLVVVQVGDLVHRGPHSEEVVAVVDRFLQRSPDRWLQLVGNHEAQYLREPAFEWRQWVNARARATLRGWWADGLMRVAAALPGSPAASAPSGPGGTASTSGVLVTHAGLTQTFWRDDLGSPSTAAQAADALNALGRNDADVIFRPGVMLGGRHDHAAGPLWASAGQELLPGWLGVSMPFDQAHGHSSAYDWQRGVYRTVPEVVGRTTLDHDGGHETTHLDGGRIVGVDPGHGAQAHHTWRAWEHRPLSAGA
nr:metallophosphoesterase [Arsenicicoccus piscis]